MTTTEPVNLRLNDRVMLRGCIGWWTVIRIDYQHSEITVTGRGLGSPFVRRLADVEVVEN